LKERRFTNPAILKSRLESGEEVSLIDVRSADEFRGPLGHIAGASNIPIAELSATIRELTEIKHKPIITI
jgi:3-mercaptopyruvate sulfurtransferase SseA